MKRTLALACCICFVALSARAEDANEVKLKSDGTARVLSLLPVNSPAAFYLERPVKGVVFSILEVGGLTSVGMGAYMLASLGSAPSGNDVSVFGEALGYSIVKGMGIGLVAIGATAWMPPWIYTVVKTSDWTDQCNEKMVKQARLSFSPLIAKRDGGAVYGLNVGFNF